MFAENVLDCGKIPWLRKIFLTVKNFIDYGKFPWMLKISFTIENFFVCRKVLDWGKKFLTVENFLVQEKLTFLTAEKIIGLIILKTNTSVENINTYLLSLEQKLKSLAFFWSKKSQYYVQLKS